VAQVTGARPTTTFLSPSRALACAAAIRKAVVPSGFAVRAGVHTGECDMDGGHLSGLPVRVSAHLSAIAAPGQLLITSTVKELMAGTHLTLTPCGSHRLTGITDAWALYIVNE
jgi:class 3 adenylate cyclase